MSSSSLQRLPVRYGGVRQSAMVSCNWESEWHKTVFVWDREPEMSSRYASLFSKQSSLVQLHTAIGYTSLRELTLADPKWLTFVQPWSVADLLGSLFHVIDQHSKYWESNLCYIHVLVYIAYFHLLVYMFAQYYINMHTFEIVSIYSVVIKQCGNIILTPVQPSICLIIHLLSHHTFIFCTNKKFKDYVSF